jgi:hypothetical protein
MLTLSEAALQIPSLVACFDSLETLYLGEHRRSAVRETRLTAAVGAFLTPPLASLMASPSWPLDLLTGSALGAGQFWSISRGGVEEEIVDTQHTSLVRKAAGVDGPPASNLRLTWSIRKYAERDNWLGSLGWVETAAERNNDREGLPTALLHRLCQLFSIARAAGAEFFLEQITIILAKDPSLPNPCLTPRLHADEYYGRRETAVVSLLEEGWSADGGTWFMPTLTMRDIGDGDQITPERIRDWYPVTPIVATGNGDLCIYDGMRNADGIMSPDLGVPHISGDIPGASSRLVVLLHHRPAEKPRQSFAIRGAREKRHELRSK